jgi:1,4-alpha-glucan branching enzyme
VYAFLRLGRGAPDGGVVACVANLTPVPRHGYRIGLPVSGPWVDVLNTDDERWGGSGVVQPDVHTDGTPWQGQRDSAVLALPPLGVRWLAPGA